MAIKNNVKAIPVQAFNAASLLVNFQPITAGIPESVFLIRIVNLSNVFVDISYDGITNHDIVPANSTLQLDFKTSSLPSNPSAHLAKGSRIFVAGTAGVGFIYMSAYFQPQS